MRGVLGGILAGAIVSVAVAVGLSVFLGPPSAPRPDAGMAEVPAGSGFNQPPVDGTTALPAPEPVETAGAASRVDAPATEELAPLAASETASAAPPDTSDVSGAMDAPEAGAEGAEMAAADPEVPVLPNPQAALPDAPETEQRLSISTDPAQPALPEAEPEQSAFPSVEVATIPGETAGAEIAPSEEPIENTEKTRPDQSSAEPVSGDPTAEQTQADTADAAPEQPEIGDAPRQSAAALPMVTEPRPVTPQAEAETPPAPLTPEQEEQTDSDRPSIGTPAVRLTERADASSRLPSVGAGTVPAVSATIDSKARPITAFAAPFENAEDKPRMAIVLIDRGDSPIGLEALAAFPYPISFAVDASRADAGAAMKTYRDAGFEVLALTDLPAGAQPRDAETVLDAVFTAVPEAVAVMEGDSTGLQESRAISDQVAGILAQSGHGLLLFPKGLNTAEKLAVKEGVPAASVFRDFDSKGQSADVIRRFLDNAAFKAGQEANGVIMVGRLRPDTVSALLLWGLQDRAARVALAPVSKLLLDSQ